MMGFLAVWSSRTTTEKDVQEEEGVAVVLPVAPEEAKNIQESEAVDKGATETAPGAAADNGAAGNTLASTTEEEEDKKIAVDKPTDTTQHPPPSIQRKRFSLRPVTLFNGYRPQSKTQKTLVTKEEENKEREKVGTTGKRAARNTSKLRSDREVKKSALTLQQLITGLKRDDISVKRNGVKAKPITKSELKKIKSQLLSPKTANRVIAILRDLPTDEELAAIGGTPSNMKKEKAGGPIKAVCLEMPDAEANEKHFSKLKMEDSDAIGIIPSFANATFDSIVPLFSNLHIVSLISAPDLGLGKTADEDGILAGAVPSAKAVIDGAVQITPQLMALGYATGRAVVPDHKDAHPPVDRISVFTYWWGLELCVPEPSMKNLANASNITHTVMNLLTALSLINGGVAEVLPFIRYISQFVDFEWSAIKAQDKGKGVVCAATWIMPAAMVPRPWDFPDPPVQATPSANVGKSAADEHEHVAPSNPDESQGESQGTVDIGPVSPAILPSLVVSSPSSESETVDISAS